MAKKLKLSVVLPCYNDRELVQKCISSLLDQTFAKKNYELLVVNDSSTDGTQEVLEKIKGIKAFLPSKRLGRSEARNFGWKHARGEIVFFAESDAVYSKNFLEESLSFFRDPKVGGTIGKLEAVNLDSVWARCKAAEYNSRFEGNYKPFTGWMYRRRIVEELNGFDSSLDIGEDSDLGKRVLQKGWKIEYARKAVWKHFEPPTLYKTLRRVWIRGREMPKYYKRNGYPVKVLFFDAVAFACLVLSIFYLPLILVFLAFAFVQSFIRRDYFNHIAKKDWLFLAFYLFSTMVSSKVGRFYGFFQGFFK